MLGAMSHTPRSVFLAGLAALVLAAGASAQPPGDAALPEYDEVRRLRIPSFQERLAGLDIRSHGLERERAAHIRVHGADGAPQQIRYHGSGGADDPSRIRVRGLGRESYFAIRSHWMGDGDGARSSRRSRIRYH
jgi:hypothetical protein